MDNDKIAEEIKEIKELVKTLIENARVIDEYLVYNTILNQNILNYLVKDPKTFKTIERKARREARRAVMTEEEMLKEKSKLFEELNKKMAEKKAGGTNESN